MVTRFWKRLSTWLSPIGLALTIAASLDPLIILAKLSELILLKWQEFLNYIWNIIFELIDIKISFLFSEFLSVFIFISFLGLLSSSLFIKNKQYELFTNKIKTIIFTLFNLMFFSLYTFTVGIRFNEHSYSYIIYGKEVELEIIALILFFSLTFVCIYVSYQKVLFRKFLTSLFVLVTIIFLDRMLFFFEGIKNA